VDFFFEFNYVAGTWFERNVLLQERRYWLGNEYLELIRFAGNEQGEMRVARDEYRPDVYVRAVKWVIADRGPDAPEGWRSLRWSDLPNLLDADALKVGLPADWPGWVIDLDDLDARVPAGVLPTDWGWQNKTAGFLRQELQTPRVREVLDSERGRLAGARAAVERLLDWRTWTVDKIELQLKRKEVREALRSSGREADLKAFDSVLTKLAELADSPRLRGTMRQLNIPKMVTVYQRGKKTKSSNPLNKQENNKFSFNLNDLKETVEFHFSGDEYSTPAKKVILVPPPLVSRITLDKEEPAYIYFRLLGDDASKLRGLRQIFRDVPASTDGPKTVIAVPLGSSLTITARVNRPLKPGTARVTEPARRDEAGSFTPPVSVTVHDEQTFSTRVTNVRKVIEFDFEFRDENNVKGRRHVMIRPVADEAPKLIGVSLAAALRPDYDPETGKVAPGRSGERLLITPNALLPFKGRAEDDHGLANVDFGYTVIAVPFQRLGEGPESGKDKPSLKLQGTPAERRAGLVASTFQYTPGMPGFEFFAPAWLGTIASLGKGGLPDELAPPESGLVEMDFFRRKSQTPSPNDVTHDQLLRLLQVQPRNRSLAAQLLDLKDDKERDKLLEEDLKDPTRRQSVFREVVRFLRLDDAQREALRPLADAEPAQFVARVLEIVKKSPEERQALVELLKKQPEKALIREHPLDQEAGFDVRAHLPRLKAIGSETQKHYELHLFVSATDNNVETVPGKAPRKGPFVFLVVSEHELIAEIIKQERKLHKLLREAVDGLEGRQTTLNAELLRLDSPQPELSFVAARADLARKAVRETGDIARAVFDKYNLILTELRVNRVEGDKYKKLEERVVTPLDELTHKNGRIAGVLKTVTDFWGGLENDVARRKKAEEAKKVDKELEERRQLHKDQGEQASREIGDMIRRLRDVLEAMQDTINLAEQIERMVRMLAEQRELERIIRVWRTRIEQDLLGGVFDDTKGPKENKR
jgi:hypothetical protein